MNNLKMFLWNSLDTYPLFWLRILFVIKFLTNLFFLSFLLLIFFLIFVNLLLTSRKAPAFVFLFFYVEPQFLTQRSQRHLLGNSVTRISPFTGPREKATFLFFGEARNWFFGFRFFLAVKRPPCLDPLHVFSLSGSKPLLLLGCFFHCC